MILKPRPVRGVVRFAAGIFAAPDGSVVPAAPLTTAPPPVASTGSSRYTIRAGDTLSSIGGRYGVSWQAIRRANPNVDDRRLRIGQTITIPVATPTASVRTAAAPALSSDVAAIYEVQPGDNLTRIARKYRTTVTRIERANGLRNDKINIGDKLKIPAP